MAIVARRRPFAALELPLWAQMTDAELDELDMLSDFSDSEASDVADVSELEGVNDDEGMDSDFEGSNFEICSSHASTGCSTPERQPFKNPCWADLEDDDELPLLPFFAAAATTKPRWADLEDDDEDEGAPAPWAHFEGFAEELNRVEFPNVKARWADLVDSDDEF